MITIKNTQRKYPFGLFLIKKPKLCVDKKHEGTSDEIKHKYARVNAIKEITVNTANITAICYRI